MIVTSNAAIANTSVFWRARWPAGVVLGGGDGGCTWGFGWCERSWALGAGCGGVGSYGGAGCGTGRWVSTWT